MAAWEEQLDWYADVAIRVGVNLQPGQILAIQSELECAGFVQRLARKAYEVGAKFVDVDYVDPALNRIRLEAASDDSLDVVPGWTAARMDELLAKEAAFLYISSPNPDLYQGIDAKRVLRRNKAYASALKVAGDERLKRQWAIVAVPTKAWAQKLFPDLSEKGAVERLWEMIFSIVRVDRKNPLEEWDKHISRLAELREYLNGKRFSKLIYTGPGTNLVVELPSGHLWMGGAKTRNGIPYVPNLPTEEVFTSPLRTGVNGTLQSTLPLNANGTVIENMHFTFENGRITDFSADSGLETLTEMIEMDEGAHYLGEVALVPVSSPVNLFHQVFLNTLLDENASCHVAIGSAFPSALEGGDSMSEEELLARGLNRSLTHVDFMVGSNELDIDGETSDGTRVPLLRNGEWVVLVAEANR